MSAAPPIGENSSATRRVNAIRLPQSKMAATPYKVCL
ncbi:Uncharacterised protein [Vibrio cholerae]|nr:Uncharacterised protein [Vibrio cholerae]